MVVTRSVVVLGTASGRALVSTRAVVFTGSSDLRWGERDTPVRLGLAG